MSRTGKDKAGGHLRRSKGLLSCGCCTTLTRELYSEERATRERAAMAYERAADGDPQFADPSQDQHGHQFIAKRCARCNLRWLDLGLPGVDPCPRTVEDDPVSYTTTTGGGATFSHRFTDF